MKRIAIFVEGMTEQEFVIALVTALVGKRGLHVLLGRQFRGLVTIQATESSNDPEFIVLVVDCANDEQVKTQIREQYTTLVTAGYSAILGLRDVYPLKREDIPAITAGLGIGLPSGPVPTEMHLAVMEIEAWFIGEKTHFSRIHETLTVPFIVGNGFDIEGVQADGWNHPAETLDQIYRLANLSFTGARGRKDKRRVQRTLRALSLDEMYVNVQVQIPALAGFITGVETALS